MLQAIKQTPTFKFWAEKTFLNIIGHDGKHGLTQDEIDTICDKIFDEIHEYVSRKSEMDN